jgi:hypothetical protein
LQIRLFGLLVPRIRFALFLPFSCIVVTQSRHAARRAIVSSKLPTIHRASRFVGSGIGSLLSLCSHLIIPIGMTSEVCFHGRACSDEPPSRRLGCATLRAEKCSWTYPLSCKRCGPPQTLRCAACQQQSFFRHFSHFSFDRLTHEHR